jgi:phosphoribosylaminoimidazolecarboxamide formyltransferase / IMP cyclohydrolase
MPDLVTCRRALVSVSDKAGLIPFAQALAALNIEIVSTGGTAIALEHAGLKVRAIDDLTGFPEILSGRVKTLHPKVHGGLLALRDDPLHRAQMQDHGIQPIDLVCVNLYPFEQAVARNAPFHETIENIDIGGPSMIRSAAKNFEYVTVVTGPAQYDAVLRDLATHQGKTSLALRSTLAADAFARTCRYDAAIAAFLEKRPATEFPPLLTANYVKADDLRYGENPHQPAALYRQFTPAGSHLAAATGTIASAEQLHGKDLSYNNILDASAALELAFALARTQPGEHSIAAAIVKHTNPCGAAIGPTAKDAVIHALAGDGLAAYGGILALSDTLDEDAANRLTDKAVFLEVIIAPKFTKGALAILQAKSTNVRLLASGVPIVRPGERSLEARSIPGGLLVQERDVRLARASELVHAAGPAPTSAQINAALALEPIARSLLSNAVLIGGPSHVQGSEPTCVSLFGAGAGQMDRVTACRIAVEKAGPRAKNALAFSDAFFPFADGPRLLIDAGVKTLVHPGGSKRDGETFDLCNQRGVTCLTTGIRHFRH